MFEKDLIKNSIEKINQKYLGFIDVIKSTETEVLIRVDLENPEFKMIYDKCEESIILEKLVMSFNIKGDTIFFSGIYRYFENVNRISKEKKLSELYDQRDSLFIQIMTESLPKGFVICYKQTPRDMGNSVEVDIEGSMYQNKGLI